MRPNASGNPSWTPSENKDVAASSATEQVTGGFRFASEDRKPRGWSPTAWRRADLPEGGLDRS